MASLIGALRVTLGLDTANFDSDARKAKSKARSLGADIKKELAGAFDLRGAITGLLSGLAVGELIAVTRRALDYASSLGEVAQQLGVTTRELQTYRYAATQVGIEQETMDKGLARLTRTIGDAAAGGKAQATVFRDLGVSITDANGNILTAGQVIPRLADALSRIKDPATRARYEVALFGKAGQQLDTLLAGGSKQVDALRNAAERLGVVLSEDAIQKADETADKLAEIKMVLEANIASAVANNADSILGLANSFIQLAAAIPGAINAYRRWRLENSIKLADAADTYFGFLPESVKGTGAARRQAQAGLAAMDAEERRQRLSNAGVLLRPGFDVLGRPIGSAPSVGGLPTVSGGGGGRKGGSGRAKAGESGKDWITELRLSTSKAISDGISDGFTDPDKAAADHAREFYDRLGLDPSGDMSAIVGGIDKRRDTRLEQVEFEAEARKKLEDELHAKRVQQTETLAGLYETLMTDGTKGFLNVLQGMGIRIIAQLAAGLSTGQSFGSSLNTALSAFGFGGAGGAGGFDAAANNAATQSALAGIQFPGFATGGSFRVGGVHGVDRNLVAFKATRNEIVDIRRPGNDNGGRSVVEIVPSDYFDVRVRKAAEPIGQAAAIGGSRMAQSDLTRRQRRRLA